MFVTACHFWAQDHTLRIYEQPHLRRNDTCEPEWNLLSICNPTCSRQPGIKPSMSRGKIWVSFEKKNKTSPLGTHSAGVRQEPLPLFSAAQAATLKQNFRQAAAKLFYCKKIPGRIHLHFSEKDLKHRRLSVDIRKYFFTIKWLSSGASCPVHPKAIWTYS